MQAVIATVTSVMMMCPIQLAVESPEMPDITEHNGAVYKDLGEFKISYYNGSGGIEGGPLNCLGEPLKEGMCAVDPDVIELGSKVLIDGKEYTACDVGGAIKGQAVDIYRDVEDVNRLGVDYFNVKERVKNGL